MSNNNIVYTSRWSARKSIISALITLLVCAALVFGVLPLIFKGKNIINGVKYAKPESYPTITYEAAFDKYYNEPNWKYKDEGGNDIVIFTGKRPSAENNVINVEILFLVKDGYFYTAGGSVNGQEKNTAGIYDYIQKPFTDYGK